MPEEDSENSAKQGWRRTEENKIEYLLDKETAYNNDHTQRHLTDCITTTETEELLTLQDNLYAKIKAKARNGNKAPVDPGFQICRAGIADAHRAGSIDRVHR